MRPGGIELALALLVAVAAWLPTHWSRGGPYVRDDPWIVEGNPALTSASSPLRFFTDPATQSRHDLFDQVTYRPLQTWTLALDVARGGARPEVFRTTNLGLHAATAALGFLLLLRILTLAAPESSGASRRAVALVASALFAAHPISGFALRYISNRSLLLVTFLSYATLLSQLGAPDRRAVRVRTFLLACLALLGRENAATLPAAVVVLEAGLRTPESWREWARRLAPVLAALAAYLALRLVLGQSTDQFGGQGPSGAERLGAFLAQGCVQLGTYLPALAWPVGVRWDPPAPGATPLPLPGLACWLVLAGILAAAAKALRRRSVPALAVLLYPVSMIPTTLLMQPAPANFYRVYPGSLFAFLGAGWVVHRALGTRGMLALALPAVLALGTLTHQQGQADADEVTMWARARRFGLSAQGRLRAAEAEPDPRRRLAALDAIIRSSQSTAQAFAARGTTRLLLGMASEALADLLEVEEAGALHEDLRLQLVVAATVAGEGAVAQAALARGPLRPTDVLQLAGAAVAAGQDAAARAALAVPTAPTGEHDWRLAELRGVLAHKAGDPARAAGHYQAVLALGASPPALRTNLGVALRQLGRCQEAIPHLQAALREVPGDQVARANLDACRMAGEEGR